MQNRYEESERASSYVNKNARDDEDAAMLLSMLGLK